MKMLFAGHYIYDGENLCLCWGCGYFFWICGVWRI